MARALRTMASERLSMAPAPLRMANAPREMARGPLRMASTPSTRHVRHAASRLGGPWRVSIEADFIMPGGQ